MLEFFEWLASGIAAIVSLIAKALSFLIDIILSGLKVAVDAIIRPVVEALNGWSNSVVSVIKRVFEKHSPSLAELNPLLAVRLLYGVITSDTFYVIVGISVAIAMIITLVSFILAPFGFVIGLLAEIIAAIVAASLLSGAQLVNFDPGVTANDVTGTGIRRQLGTRHDYSTESLNVLAGLVLAFVAIVFGFLGAVLKDTGALAGIGIGLSVAGVLIKAYTTTPGLSQGDKDLYKGIAIALSVGGLILALLGYTSTMKGAKVLATVSTGIGTIALLRALGV